MIIVNPKIESLDPNNRIIIVLGPDGIHGISNDLTLHITCHMFPAQTTDVNIKLRLLDPALYCFDDNTDTKEIEFQHVQDGDVLSPRFRIRNIDPVALDCRIKVTASDVNPPSTTNSNSAQYPVITKPFHTA